MNRDNKTDRKVGEYWERQFCLMAAEFNKSFTPMQIGRDKSATAFCRTNGKWHTRTLPDVTVWTAPGEHHEIKHKNPTSYGTFGLEKYRLDALLWFAHETGQDVMYTIHNHDLAGGREVQTNNIEHWMIANILDLNNKWSAQARLPSYVNGQMQPKVLQYFWPAELWQPLADYWRQDEL